MTAISFSRVSSPASSQDDHIERKAVALLLKMGTDVQRTWDLAGKRIRFETEADNGKSADRKQVSTIVTRVVVDHKPNRGQGGQEFTCVRLMLLGTEDLFIQILSSDRFGWKTQERKVVQRLTIEE